MQSPSRSVAKPRPVYLNLARIRQPIPAIASVLHRISGALLFFIGVPALLWALQASLASTQSYESMRAFVAHPLAKLVFLALVWAYLQHAFAGIRHLLQDVHVGVELKSGRQSAMASVVAALVLTALLAIRLW